MSDKLIKKIKKAIKTFNKISDLIFNVLIQELIHRKLLLNEESEEDKVYNQNVVNFFFEKIIKEALDINIISNPDNFKDDNEIIYHIKSIIISMIDKEDNEKDEDFFDMREELSKEELDEYDSFNFQDKNDINFTDK
jgi:hypothetical protein